MSGTGELRDNTTAGLYSALVLAMFGLVAFAHAETRSDDKPSILKPGQVRYLTLASGQRGTLELGELKACETDRLLVSLDGAPFTASDRIQVELTGSGSDRVGKDLHAGDPDLYVSYRPSQGGQASLSLTRIPNPARRC